MACQSGHSSYHPITEPPPTIEGYELVWNDEFAEYTAASINTAGKKTFQYGIFES